MSSPGQKKAVVDMPWRGLMDIHFAPAVGRRERVRNPVFLTKTLRNVSSAIFFSRATGSACYSLLQAQEGETGCQACG